MNIKHHSALLRPVGELNSVYKFGDINYGGINVSTVMKNSYEL